VGAKLGPFDTKPRTSRFGRKAATKDRSLAPSGAMRSRRRPVPNNLLGVAFKSGLPRATPALARDSGRNVRPVFLEPSHCLRSIDDTLEGFPGWILEGVGSQSIHHMLNEVMQAFVSSSAFEGVRNRVLAQPCWAKSIMLGTSASLNQGVASNSRQRMLPTVWQVAWIIGSLRSPANNPALTLHSRVLSLPCAPIKL